MYELKKKLESCLRVNLLGPGPRLIKEEFTGPRSHKSWETLVYTTSPSVCVFIHPSAHWLQSVYSYSCNLYWQIL